MSSSGVFTKDIYGSWFYKEKEAIDYIIRISENILTKKLVKEKKEDLSSKNPKSKITSKTTKASTAAKSNSTKTSKMSKKERKKQGYRNINLIFYV